jgi:hypothetical protein
MRLPPPFIVVGVAFASAVACNAVSGIEDFSYDRIVAGGGGPGGAGGAAGPGGAGGSGGACPNTVDGTCCDTSCEGTCAACNLEGSVGVCTPISAGTDPEEECAGSCNGDGACADATIAAGAVIRGDGMINLKDIGVDDAGRVVISGTYNVNATAPGGPTETTAGSYDALLVGLDPMLGFRWSSRFGGAGVDVVTGIDVAPAGDMVAAGDYEADITLTTSHTAVGGKDAWVAKLDASGTIQWGVVGGGAGNDKAVAASLEADGDVSIVGYLSSVADLGGGPIGQMGSQDGLLWHLSGVNGGHLLSRAYGDAAQQVFVGAHYNGLGELGIASQFDGVIDLGGHSPNSNGALDVLAFRVDAAGTSQWARAAGDGFAQFASAISADANGDYFMVGALTGAVDFGDGATTGGSNADAFVVKLDRATGVAEWSRRFGDLGEQNAMDVAIDSNGVVVVVGCNEGVLTGGLDISSQDADAFVLALTAAGEPLWALRFGGVGYDCANGVAISADDSILVTGVFSGMIDLGDGPVSAAGGRDGFVVAISR